MSEIDGNFLPNVILAVVLATGLATHGYLKKSLSFTGALSAFFVGFTSFAVSNRFGVILILFYYTSSKLTKLKENVKAKLEDGYALGGQRGAVQVFACSLLGTISCIMFFTYIGQDCHVDFNSRSSESMVDFSFFRISKNHAAAYLWSMYIAHYSCATADTWASELGILSTEKPRLITTLFIREVPHGTNGGVSVMGTLASMAGGSFIGIIFWIMSLTNFPLKFDRPAQYPMIFVGLLCGFLGSLIDSLLGATVQATYYSAEKKCITKNINSNATLISGIDIISNESVNLISILLTMLLSIWLSPVVFCLCDSNQC